MSSMIRPATNRLLPTLVAAALLTLPACGFRGPLYLPGETPPGTETPAQTTEDGAEKDEAEEGDDEGNDGEGRDGDPSAPARL